MTKIAQSWAGTRLRACRVVPTTTARCAFLQSAGRAVGADDVSGAEGAVRAGGAGQRRAGGAAEARLVPELIEATGGGLLLEPEDPADLARVLGEMLDQPELRAELGRKGQEAVHERFHAAAMAERTVDVYRKYLFE